MKTTEGPRRGQVHRRLPARHHNAKRMTNMGDDPVFPKLREIESHRGAYLLLHPINGGVKFFVLTLWDSMAAIRKFTGGAADRAVVEPEAQSVLGRFVDFVIHFEVVHKLENSKSKNK